MNGSDWIERAPTVVQAQCPKALQCCQRLTAAKSRGHRQCCACGKTTECAKGQTTPSAALALRDCGTLAAPLKISPAAHHTQDPHTAPGTLSLPKVTPPSSSRNTGFKPAAAMRGPTRGALVILVLTMLVCCFGSCAKSPGAVAGQPAPTWHGLQLTAG